MGLDAVYLVIRLEDTFGIVISDEAAEQLTTPRQVTDFIMTKVAVGGHSACLSQQAFYFLRQGFLKRLRIQRSAFRPDVTLKELIPRRGRETVWVGLKAELGEKALPNLARPLWLFSFLTIATILIGLFTFQTTHDIWQGVAVTGLMGWLSSVVSQPFRTDFRWRFSRVGGLAEHLVLHSPHTFKHERRAWTRTQVAEVVRVIIVEETGITDFTEDSHFINDMHIG